MPLRVSVLIIAISLITCCSDVFGADHAAFSKELFSDDFSATTLNKQWKLYKAQSKIEAGILIAEEQDGGGHAAVHGVIIEPVRDLEVAVSFRFAGAKNFSVTFNDKDYKGSHAGHIARVQITPKGMMLRDEKTGIFKNEIYDMKEKDAATLELLKTKAASFPISFAENTWYKLVVRSENDTLIAIIDDKEVGRFSSEGFAHDNKTKPALVVSGIAAHFDNVVMRTH